MGIYLQPQVVQLGLVHLDIFLPGQPDLLRHMVESIINILKLRGFRLSPVFNPVVLVFLLQLLHSFLQPVQGVQDQPAQHPPQKHEQHQTGKCSSKHPEQQHAAVYPIARFPVHPQSAAALFRCPLSQFLPQQLPVPVDDLRSVLRRNPENVLSVRKIHRFPGKPLPEQRFGQIFLQIQPEGQTVVCKLVIAHIKNMSRYAADAPPSRGDGDILSQGSADGFRLLRLVGIRGKFGIQFPA